MLSVIVPTHNSAAQLARALAPLVAGAAEGVVKEVIVADAGSHDATRTVADDCGCVWIESAGPRARQFRDGAAAARGTWLLFLWPQTELGVDWLDEAGRFMARAENGQRAGCFRLDATRAGRLARLLEFWRRLGNQPSGASGMLIARSFYEALGGYRIVDRNEDRDLARRLGARRLVFLNALARTETLR